MTDDQLSDRGKFIAVASIYGIVVVHQVHPTFHGHVQACDTDVPYVEVDAGGRAKIICESCHDVVARWIRDRDKFCGMFGVPPEMVPLRGVDGDHVERRVTVPVPPPSDKRRRFARLLPPWFLR